MTDFFRVSPLETMDSNPGLRSSLSSLGKIVKGEHLIVVNITGDWYQVGRSGQLQFTGWVRKDALRRVSPLEQLAKQAE